MVSLVQKESFITKAKSYKKPQEVKYTYGTAGFRLKAELLDSVVFRVGILASIRSVKKGGKAIGVMITASHNPVADNGVKIVDPMGEMLESSWESYATALANAQTEEDLHKVVQDQILKEQGIDASTLSKSKSHVVIARDTRPSGEKLANAAVEGAKSLFDSAQVTDCGILTTPQCHYIVRCLNEPSYGEPSEDGYYAKFAQAYLDLVATVPNAPISELVLDAANGVGGDKAKRLSARIASQGGAGSLKLQVINVGTEPGAVLNHQCGSDHVKVTQSHPLGVNPDKSAGKRFASVDGDADRLVYFYFDAQNKFHLLDGDKIATLAANYFGALVKTLELDLEIGIVQTAYANGSSTKYVKEKLGLPVACVETGVKHLHHKAEEFDIGIYFEANGHGTILFGSKAWKSLEALSNRSSSLAGDKLLAFKRLRGSMNLINQAVGDALSVMLFVECVLLIEGKTPEQWDSDYKDFASILLKAKVKDRSAFKTIKADTELVQPEGLQAIINGHVAKFEKANGRCFVRPSGTEDVVRVYAEAETQAQADELGNIVLKELAKYAN